MDVHSWRLQWIWATSWALMPHDKLYWKKFLLSPLNSTHCSAFWKKVIHCDITHKNQSDKPMQLRQLRPYRSICPRRLLSRTRANESHRLGQPTSSADFLAGILFDEIRFYTKSPNRFYTISVFLRFFPKRVQVESWNFSCLGIVSSLFGARPKSTLPRWSLSVHPPDKKVQLGVRSSVWLCPDS